ncbi:phage portal protein family protein [Gordonia sp. (in: high G+C Gram-positive bacteria)]|uniref:phage portal protein family protein n=1 Tax=Gordonia sp. (in: high G+C Gram-positive bacteria) TaxID=84139 RepID=UPI003C71FC74
MPVSPAVREKGYVVSDANALGVTFEDWTQGEQVPDLRWPRNLPVLARMEREDSRVQSLLAAIEQPIIQTKWWIDPNGAPDEVVEFVSKNMGLPIVGEAGEADPLPRARGRFSWSQHLVWMLNGVNVFGHSVFEQVYRYDEGSGQFWLHKLAPRPQHTIEAFETARDGGLISIVQKEAHSGQTARLPVKRLVVYTRNMLPGQWQGRSLLRSPYKNWLLKDELIRIQAVAIRRNGMGVPVGTSPENATQDEVDALGAIAQQYRGGENAGVGLPPGSDLKLLGVQGNLPDIQRAIDYHDKSIALAGLAHFLNLSGGGSYALASVQENTFVQSVQSFGESQRDTANQHVIEDLVDINFGPDVQAPRLVFDSIGSQQDANASSLKLLVDAGLLSPDVLTEQTLRQRLDLPALSPPTTMSEEDA